MRGALFEDVLLALSHCAHDADLSPADVQHYLGAPDWRPQEFIAVEKWLYRHTLASGVEVDATVSFFEGRLQSIGFRGRMPWDERVRLTQLECRDAVFVGKGNPGKGIPAFYASRRLHEVAGGNWEILNDVCVATVSDKSRDTLLALLEGHGISSSSVSGMLVCCINVNEKDAEEAFALLWQDAKQKRYWARFDCKGGIQNFAIQEKVKRSYRRLPPTHRNVKDRGGSAQPTSLFH